MKKVKILIVLLFTFSLTFSQKWTECNKGDNGKLNDIYVVNTSTAYAVGESESNIGMMTPMVLKTTDEGKTWENVGKNLPGMMSGTIITELLACYFINENIGWVAGRTMPVNCLFKTEDGGNTWMKQEIEGISPVCDIQFLDKNTGFACGTNGLFLRTENGGASWEQEKFADLDNYNSLHFFDKNKGIVVNYTSMGERIKKTEDGGKTWKTVYNKMTSDMLRGIYFVSDKTGFVSGEHGAVLKSTDGGNTWKELKISNHGSSTFEDFYFFSVNSGIAVSSANTVCKTSDGGKTWKNETSSIKDNFDLYAIDFKTKKISEKPIDENYKNVTYEAVGYTVGDECVIYKTNRQFTVKEKI
ncbi:MAG: hypothetical protein K8R54_05600 [Bacteroidales bacterium]|nr:hypothetical protein [Bacteroidales bacterium]